MKLYDDKPFNFFPNNKFAAKEVGIVIRLRAAHTHTHVRL